MKIKRPMTAVYNLQLRSGYVYCGNNDLRKKNSLLCERLKKGKNIEINTSMNVIYICTWNHEM